jgi:phosphoribosylaminoimidazole synthetase
MPGTYTKGKFDIAGFSVGLVEKKKILNKKIRSDDLILAVPSNGLHSNGYSLVRYLLKKKKINFKTSKFLKNELIRPTKIYVKELSLINEKNLINGCANITGGGLVDNIQRIIPKNLCADIDLNRVKTLKIFTWLNKMGVSEKEMLKTFNCGVGFCLVANPKNLNSLSKYFGKKFKPYVIGKIVKNSKKVKLSGKISW